MVQIQYLYNINEPSEWTSDQGNWATSGDEFNLVIKYEGVDLFYNVPYDNIEDRYIQSKRNSIIRFYDLMIPCNGLRLHLKEKDANKEWDDYSNTISFDCSTYGVTENLFWIGDNPAKGKYRLITTV